MPLYQSCTHLIVPLYHQCSCRSDEEIEEEEEGGWIGNKPMQAYDSQQEELRKAFMSAAVGGLV